MNALQAAAYADPLNRFLQKIQRFFNVWRCGSTDIHWGSLKIGQNAFANISMNTILFLSKKEFHFHLVRKKKIFNPQKGEIIHFAKLAAWIVNVLVSESD